MCDPLSAAVVVGTGLSIYGDVQEHKAQSAQAKANKAAALAALRLQDHELSIEEVQSRIAGTQQIEQGDQAVRDAAGEAQASAAARGVGGVSIDLLLDNVQAQGARFRESVQQNTDAQAAALERQKDAALAEAQARIAGVSPASALTTGLKIGSDIVNGATLLIGRNNKAKGA
jgi:hypothetical protein